MKTIRAIQRTLSAGAAVCLATAALSGCELLVDFDRSKIPVEAGSAGDDATLTDSATPTEAGDDGTVSGEVGPDEAGDDTSEGAAGDAG
ncbi:MAG: hypothetical protein M3O36_19005, partial [Myxococcota bacterium]|nr:hypothetical protein [Myxococcota bacterium]